MDEPSPTSVENSETPCQENSSSQLRLCLPIIDTPLTFDPQFIMIYEHLEKLKENSGNEKAETLNKSVAKDLFQKFQPEIYQKSFKTV